MYELEVHEAQKHFFIGQKAIQQLDRVFIGYNTEDNLYYLFDYNRDFIGTISKDTYREKQEQKYFKIIA